MTSIQKLAGAAVVLIGSVLTALVAFGVDLTTEQIAAILGAATAFLSFAVLADAIIRNGRSKVAAQQLAIDYDAFLRDFDGSFKIPPALQEAFLRSVETQVDEQEAGSNTLAPPTPGPEEPIQA